MGVVQWISIALIVAAGLYLAVRARGWKHRTLGTMLFSPGEATVHEDAGARYAIRHTPRGGRPRAMAFLPIFTRATVRVTNRRVVLAVPPLGGGEDRVIMACAYPGQVPPDAGDALSVGYPSFAVAPGTMSVESRDGKTVVELPSDGSVRSGIERVWIETENVEALRALFA